MKILKDFGEFLKQGIVKVQSPDKSRAKFLIFKLQRRHDVLAYAKKWLENGRQKIYQKFHNKGINIPQ